jgi:tetratricopeptide (TPR) repeat protein
MKWRVFAIGCAVAVSTVTGTLAATAGDPADAREVAAIRARSPHAAELLEQGEALVAGGRTKEAEALFKEAHTEDPEGSILWRRDCEALVAMGQRDEAAKACATAVGAWRSSANLLALVKALVDGPSPPTTVRLAQALQIVAHEHHFGPSITAAAAACEIAESIGDNVMLQGCAQELQRINPDHPATLEALSRLDVRCPPWRFWLGWGAILAAILATLVHALAHKLRGLRSRRAGVVVVAMVSVAIGSWTRAAAADPREDPNNWLSKIHIDEQHPDSSMPTEAQRNADPLEFGYWLQDIALKGEHASKRGNHAAAARFYEALVKAVPDRSIGYVKACEEYEATGDLEQAINRCGQALLVDGARVSDYTHFVRLVLSKPGKLTDKDAGALAQVLSHMREDPAGQPFVDDLECQVGTRTTNVAELKECTAGLAARAPKDPKTISYEWALAAASGDARAAEALLAQASAAGVAPASIEQMKKETASLRMRSALRTTAFTAAIGLLLAGIVVAVRTLLARRRLAIPAVS